jgi:hypothetical protein
MQIELVLTQYHQKMTRPEDELIST